MPFFKDAFSYGNLYVKFSVTFPERGLLTPDKCEALKRILPAPKTVSRTVKKGEANVEYLEEFHEADLNPNPEGGQNRNHDHDEDEDH
jgi:DnaJ family protein A protein 2